MKTNKRIKSYNKKYVEQLEEALRIVKPYLIEAFTNFYGEEYQSQIKYTIENIKYTYFLSESMFQVIKNRSCGVSHKDYHIVKYYIQYLRKIDFKFNGIEDLDKLEQKVLNAFIVKSSLDKNMWQYAHFLELLESDCPVYSVASDAEEQNFYKSILLPIFVIDLEIIIHEINHALMIDVIATTKEKVIMPSLFTTEECDELFNDYIAHLVLEEYFKLKAPIPYPLRKFKFMNVYENYFYLIELFYYVFEKVIKRSIMTKNFNLLYEYAGKENFDLFCNMVQKYYLQDGCSEDEFQDLLDLVQQMNEHALAITPIDYESYLNELESMGIKVRRLK